MLEGYEIDENKKTVTFEEFTKKYNSKYSEKDLAEWSIMDANGAIDTAVVKFNPNTMSAHEGKAMPDVLYASGNIYKKLEQLEREKKELKPNQYTKQKKLLDKALPKKRKVNEIHFSPLSSFIKDFSMQEDQDNNEENTRLISSVLDWLQDSVSYHELKGASKFDISEYVQQTPVRKQKHESNEEANYRRTTRREMAEKLFNTYIREGLNSNITNQLVEQYNQVYNGSVRPDFTKIPIFLDGMSSTFKGKPLEIKQHQLEGLAYLASSGKGVVAYDVGLGKTMVGITGIMQAMQRNWAKKPLIVVPKAVMQNWVREFKDLFPNTKINILGNLGKDFAPDPEKLQIKDGTVSIVSYEGMKRIGYTDENLIKLQEGITDVMSAGLGSQGKTKRQKQKKDEKAGEFVGRAQKGAQFLMEDLGFDHMTIDEAHNMKNVFERAESAKGGKRQANEFRYLTGASSERGVKAFLHSQYIQKNNNGRNVTLLTATPFTNSPIEIYSMLSHVSRDKLQEKGLYNINDFVSHFVDLQSEYVIKGNGQIQTQDVAKGFKNLKELQEIVKDAIDFKTGVEVKIKRPNKTENLVELPPTKEQRQIIEEAEKEYMRAQLDPKANPAAALLAIDKQRKATLSPKLVTGQGHFVKDSPKLKYTCDSVAKVNKQRPEVGQVIYLPRGIDYYPEVKNYLMEQGVDSKSISFINSTTSDTKKQDIMDEFNDPNGNTKIIIGSETIKEGVNLQSNTAVLYNTFLGWNPTELEQLRGRIWRHGNKQKNVNIVYPVNVDSIDSVMYQKHDEKSKRIGEIWKFKGDYVDVSPIDPFETKYEIIKDPEKRASFKMRLELDKLEKDKLEKEALAGRIQRLTNGIAENKTELKNFQEGMPRNQKLLDTEAQNIQEITKKLKDAQKTKDKNLIKELSHKHDQTKEDHSYQKRLLNKRNKAIDKSKEKIESLQGQIKALGIQNEADAKSKMEKINFEHTEIKNKINTIQDNKLKYIAKAKKEIQAMQKPLASVEQSTSKMVNQVLTSIQKTDMASIQETNQKFAASLARVHLLPKKTKRSIIQKFIREHQVARYN